MKILWRPNIGMWGVNPEARGWNVGAVCSDLNLAEHIWKKSPKCTFFWPFYWKGQIRVCFGLFLLIHSTKLKSEHTAPTFQPLASGLTPHMPMFWHHEIFTFWWEGKILKWKSTQLTVKNFVKKNYIPILIYERQPNQVQPQFFGDSILFHHYLLYNTQFTLVK